MLHTDGPSPLPTIVRYGFSEFDTWAPALPNVPLRAMATFGALDAPDVSPAGSTRAWGSKPRISQSVTFRE